ncbi:MAG: VWA domain-containing protein [Tidjanibacter sp.]|nr:VWA domain-containing protein [Tidjanibacter sp.]MBR3931359.1 VWA domain-containing protein [Tidjanibacter sp.]
MFRFAHIEYFWLLLLVPLLVAVMEWSLAERKRKVARLATSAAFAKLSPESSTKKLRTKFWLLMLALVALIFAAARPQMGSKLSEVEREGVEIMVAVDVSNSMLASDFAPNRLERTKYAVERVIEGLSEDRIGVIVFAGDAYVQLPITADYLTARNFVRQISTSQVTRQGTAIGAAIELATRSFSSQSESSRVLVLVTDGENHEDDALAMAEKAAAQGVKIYTIGIGTPEGAPISIGDDFIRDEKGEIVVSKLDEEVLQKIAVTTGGAYVRATTANVGLGDIISLINRTEKSKFKSEVFEEYNELYPIPLAIALALLLLECVVLPRKNRVLARFNLFGEKRG